VFFSIPGILPKGPDPRKGFSPGQLHLKNTEVQRTLLRHKHLMDAGKAAWKT
jgi:hypothetical protein